ncbi:MAG: 50S ribosomal protein L35 [Desulfobulbaceae bacterium A2]|nr:MAG: 50S ribosomal protein L35 [Desulfobulbaceae bacterium A2]
MPKMKTNRGAAKRFRLTGSGKLRRNKAYRRHILTSKTTKQKRQLRKSGLIHPADQPGLMRILPYY